MRDPEGPLKKERKITNVYFAANWKMNGSLESINQLINSLSSRFVEADDSEIIIFPPSAYLSHTKSLLSNLNWYLGGQDVSNFDQGAYTGEISASMLRDLGCTYVLVGHSERRHIIGESYELVAQKFSKAIEHKLIPVLCIGETIEQRKSKETNNIIDKQLRSVLDLPTGPAILSKGIIAYEPVWAIGTGVSAKPDDVINVHTYIKSWLLDNGVQDVPIIYGGSVNPQNAFELISKPEVDGVLVGGASLDADKFLEILQCIN